ncbi:MFS transporter [Peribacillus frigoritolerans]
MNSIGRRPVIIFGFVIMTVGMLILGLFHNAPIWVVLLGFGLYAFFSGAPNILSFIYPNELFPTEIRESAVGFGTAFTRIVAAAGTFGLPYALNSFGIENTMLICAAMSFLGVLICVAWAT